MELMSSEGVSFERSRYVEESGESVSTGGEGGN
jgi:hypothetical protein